MPATRILYLAHDLDDAAIWRRRAMLRLGGAEVDMVGFRRSSGPLPAPARVFGRTRNARMGQRLWSVARARMGLGRALRDLDQPDIILARNLETLPLAVAAARRFTGQTRPQVVYEVLDIHRLMLRPDSIGRSLRAAERKLTRAADLVLVSSPAFQREYFARVQSIQTPVHLVENRVVTQDGHPPLDPVTPARDRRPEQDGPLIIGWFGILRCKASLVCLDAATRASPGRIQVVLRGRPARDAIPDFDAIVQNNPDLIFLGAYAYPDDLLRIYGEIDLAWLIDRYDAGQNSDWLLPNRFYESGLAGVPALGLAGTEVAREMARLGIGLVIDGVSAGAVNRTLGALKSSELARLRQAQRKVEASNWVAGTSDGRALVTRMLGKADAQSPATEMEVQV
jgi:hypothetical protein